MRRAILVAVFVGLVGAACGGGDSTATTARPTTPGATTTTTTRPGVTATTLPGGTVGSVPGVTGECLAAAQAFGLFQQAVGAALAPGAGGDITAIQAQLAAAVDSAPAEIKADFEVIVQAVGDFIVALQASGYDASSGAQPTPEQSAAIQAASEEFNTAEVDAASARIQAYLEANCKQS